MARRLSHALPLVLLLSYCAAGARTGAGHAAAGSGAEVWLRAGAALPAGARRARLESDAATFQSPHSARRTASPRIVGGTQVRPAHQQQLRNYD